MLLHIPRVLTESQIARGRPLLEQAKWVDGRATAGHLSARAKHSLQVAEGTPEARELGEVVVTALERTPLFMSAALPLRVFPPLFNRYEPGMTFGAHVDNAIRQVPGTPHRVRTDLSMTLFLSEPSEYDGGELMIDTAGVARSWKGNAGDAIVYPADTLHRVAPVTRGNRDVAISWLQSMVREPERRRILFDVRAVLDAMDRAAPPPPEAEILRRSYFNLIRMWA
jgi:PKHD-type hydroxylase